MMKKSTKWSIGIFVFAVLALVVLFSTGIIQQSALGGYQILSLSKASIVQDGTLGQSWLVTVSTIPSSFAITGKIQASDVALQAGQAPVSDFDIYMSVNQQLKYLITESDDNLYDYYMTASDSYSFNTDGLPDCPTNSGNEAISGKVQQLGWFNWRDYCVYQVYHGSVGTLSANPAIPSQITIQVTANGQTSSSVTLNTDKETTGSTNLMVGGKNLGRVYYSGDLVNSAQFRPELFQNYKPINKDGRWYFTSMSAYNTYNGLNGVGYSTIKQNIDNCLVNAENQGDWSADNADDVMRRCVNNYHNAYASLAEVSVSNLKQIASDGGGIYATFTADKLYAFPQLTFFLDTDWVAIKVLKGTPKVNSLSITQDCTSGSHGRVQAVVSNTGGGVGAFDVSMSCPDTDVITSVLTDNWQPAEEKKLVFEYDMNAIMIKTTRTCTVTAKDKGSSVFDQKTIDVSCNPTQVCVPSQGFCDGQVKKQCNSEGSGFVTVIGDTSCQNQNKCKVDTDCGATNKCQNGVCVNLGQTCQNQLGGLIIASYGTVESCSFWCQIGLAKPTPINTCIYDNTPLIILIVAIVVIVALIVFMQKPKKGKKGGLPTGAGEEWYKKKSVWIIIAVLAGILLIIFYFKYFFWGLVILIILAVLLFIFRKTVIGKIAQLLG